jgi:hypothetical protein
LGREFWLAVAHRQLATDNLPRATYLTCYNREV